MHQRMRPSTHRFTYPIFMLRLDLEEVELVSSPLSSPLFGINQTRILSFWSKDYGPRDGTSLLSWIKTLALDNDVTGIKSVTLQTFPRVFGYAFNPISLWYCYDESDVLKTVLAEVNNTFGEHHFYLLKNKDGAPITKASGIDAKKMMHVSPFCEIKGSYHFQFKEHASRLIVKIDYFDEEDDDCKARRPLLKTVIAGVNQELNTRRLLLALLKQPFLTLGVFFRIHWQAMLLWKKKVPFFKQVISQEPILTVGIPTQQENPK